MGTYRAMSAQMDRRATGNPASIRFALDGSFRK
jgi:hypothetical protein